MSETPHGTETAKRNNQPLAETAPMCVFTLPRRARAGVVGLIDFLRHSDYYASAFDDAVEFTLDTRGYVTEEQSDGGLELIDSVYEQLAGPGRHIRLSADESRLLRELLDNVLNYQRDYDWRIEATAEAALNLTDAPTEREYSTGAWALEQTRARLTGVPPRPALRQGDILHIPDTADLDAPDLPGEGDYEMAGVSDSDLDLVGPDGRGYHIRRTDIDRISAELEQRFASPGVSLPELHDPPPPSEPPWTEDDRALHLLIATVTTATRHVELLERDIAACEAGTFQTSNPERTADKLRRQLPPWQETIERALPQIDELKQRPTERTASLVAALDRALR